jgi:hypothetical protein
MPSTMGFRTYALQKSTDKLDDEVLMRKLMEQFEANPELGGVMEQMMNQIMSKVSLSFLCGFFSLLVASLGCFVRPHEGAAGQVPSLARHQGHCSAAS